MIPYHYAIAPWALSALTMGLVGYTLNGVQGALGGVNVGVWVGALLSIALIEATSGVGR